MIRRTKLSYLLYNLFQKKNLAHNVPLYKKLGLNKKYFSPISSKDFYNVDPSILIDDGPQKHLSDCSFFNKLNPTSQQSAVGFEAQGYCILSQYMDHDKVDKINTTIDDLTRSGTLKYKYGNKLMFAIHHSDFLNNLWEDDELLEFLSILIHGEAALFQSINFIMGSQQKTHSDSIHMTTFPLGGLLGVWLALEDIGPDQGPLHYYPGSHKLPYYLNKDYDNEGTALMLGANGYTAYEEMLKNKIAEQNIEKETFNAEKGDLLIWHANLLHGGEPHRDKEKTRRSMVMHYFDVNRICYHEITQRPALMNKAI